IDFAVNPVTITVNVTGAVTQVLTHTINTGTLASDATIDVPMPTMLDMTTAGVYTFDAHTTMTGDTNPADDAMATTERTKQLVNAGIAVVTPDSKCVSGQGDIVLSTDGSELGFASLQWQQSTTTGTGFTDIPGATTVPYTLPASPTQNMYYRLVATCGTSSATSPEAFLTINNPELISTTPGSRCGPGEVTLNATSAPGTNINWYDAPTGGMPIATGPTLDRKSTRLNSSHVKISYAVFCLKKKNNNESE